MDILEAFQSAENFLAYFSETSKIHEEHKNFFEALIAEEEAKFQDLLNDKPTRNDNFLVPEIPKIKKEVKEKRESRATKKTLSIVSKNATHSETINSQSDEEVFRRSSRIASKAKLKKESIQSVSSYTTSPPAKKIKSKNVFDSVTSPSFPSNKIHNSGDTESKAYISKPLLDETMCTTDMKQPLGSSTPTEVLEEKENLMNAPNTEEIVQSSINPEQKTPVSDFNRPVIKGESVKKRVEEFEKRTQAAVLSASKLPVKTPEKKIISSASKFNNHYKVNNLIDSKVKMIFSDKEVSISSKERCTRNNSKVLQEKSANVKMIKEKGQEAQKKKDVMMKASTEETKRKREERVRKVAAQREAVEKEKLELALKLEKEKDEKLKLIQKQKEEKLKMDCLKKKQLAAIKAAEAEERRKKEEAAKLAKLKETGLKSESCDSYAIDHILDGAPSDDEEKPKNQIPSWATKENRAYPLMVQAWLNKKETVYPWFYNKNLKYPKLEELFSADVKTRPRTSSAFWNTKVAFDESFPFM